MHEIRFHGRGGQGAVTAAEVLAKAAAHEDKYCQAFPFFGVERRGAPVMAFTRIDDKPILVHQQVYSPKYIVVLDSSLLSVVDVTEGLTDDGVILINSTKHASEFDFKHTTHTIDATSIALKNLGKPIVNTVMLGAFVSITGLVKLNSIKEVIKKRFPGELGNKNAKALDESHRGIDA